MDSMFPTGALEEPSLVEMPLMLLSAVAMSAAIAWHPLVRRKAQSLEQLDAPKTFLVYGLVGALVAIIVQVNSIMALAIFGLGGLLRFRTDVGQAKDTGRVILVTVVGLCCGLGLYVVAALATAIAWVLIWLLESRGFGRLVVMGLEVPVLGQASQAYGDL